MNLVLLEREDFVSESRVRFGGRRRDHVLKILRAKIGDTLVVGRADGEVGRGEICGVDCEAITMDVVLDAPPPAPLPVTLVLALPRPPVLRRVLIGVAAMGVKRIALIGARAVEKSFWQSHALGPEAIREQLVLGLEQGRDTVLPSVELIPRFRPFVEDLLPAWLEDRPGYLAHPTPDAALPKRRGVPALLAVGPEGGWSDYEVERLLGAGLDPLGLGQRPLRVETAVPALLARLL